MHHHKERKKIMKCGLTLIDEMKYSYKILSNKFLNPIGNSTNMKVFFKIETCWKKEIRKMLQCVRHCFVSQLMGVRGPSISGDVAFVFMEYIEFGPWLHHDDARGSALAVRWVHWPSIQWYNRINSHWRQIGTPLLRMWAVLSAKRHMFWRTCLLARSVLTDIVGSKEPTKVINYQIMQTCNRIRLKSKRMCFFRSKTCLLFG